MIKFFRRIRQQLIKRKSMSKYLLYAAGEIVLVVIGILLALSINNWNQQRLNQRDELSSIELIAAEVESNYENFQVSYQHHITRDSAARALLFSNLESFDLNTLDYLFGRSFYSYQYNASFSAYNSLVSEGKLDNLTNDELKLKLVKYKELIEDYQEGEDDAWEFSKLRIFEEELKDTDILTEVQFGLRERTDQENKADLKHYQTLFSDPSYRNLVSLTVLHVEIILDKGGILDQEFQSLKQMLNDNIKALRE